MNKRLSEIYLKQMKECSKYETEYSHIEADNILCELLEKLGYTELIETYQKLDKWYS